MRLLKTSLVFLFLSLATFASAQNVSDIDFANIDVDALSNQQIQQIYEEAQSRGLSSDQVVDLAVARGMPQTEASKLRQRLQMVQAGGPEVDEREGMTDRMRVLQSDTARSNYFDNLFGDETGRTLGTEAARSYQAYRDSIWLSQQRLKDRIFGFQLFTDQDVEFEPNLNIPTPKDYQLGPGDELYIDIWGAAQNNYRLQVSPDGMILVPHLGPIYVNGMQIDVVREQLKERFSEIYSGLNPEDENQQDTYMQVTLGQIRSINVTVVGEATQPGTYTLPSLATVFNALYTSGGPSSSGSLRNIHIIRGDTSFTFDLYDVLINRDQSDNIRLRDQDVIQITPYENRVEVLGNVKRPGIYELTEGETMQDLITFAGDFTGDAYTHRIKVIGSSDKEKRIVDITKENFDDQTLKNGDKVRVGEILNRFENRVEIEGAVFRPGDYELRDTTSLYSLIQRADGLKGDAFMNRGLIYRTKDDFTLEAISFDLRKVMNNPDVYDIPLVKDDVVQISSIFDLRESYTVGISGPVQQPGQYRYAEDMTLEDLIFQADGFRQSAAPYRIEVARRVRDVTQDRDPNKVAEIFSFTVDEDLQLDSEDAEFKLDPFDQVYIRSLPNYQKQSEISIVGEVQYPGTYSISSKDERISDLIERAGGLTSEAYLTGATLFRKRKFTEQQAQQNLANVEGLTQEEQEEMLNRRGSAQVGINLSNVLEQPGSKYDLLVEEGDSLFIPKQLETVTIKGGVFYPTTTRYEEGFSFRDYITSAGGFTDLAKKKRAYIIYANGKVNRVKTFLFFKNYPSVEPGATIIVPEKPDPIRLSPQERISILSTIVSTAALITTTIVQISNN